MSEILALLQTDVVDSTALSQRLGDDAISDLWIEHDRTARSLLANWRGREIDKSDGFLLIFKNAVDAARYAFDYHRALSGLNPPLQARAGLHVAAVVTRANSDEDVARGAKPLEIDGLAKPLTARVMSLAGPGQTLTTVDAISALEPATLRTRDLGHWSFKGLDEPVQIFEVTDGQGTLGSLEDTTKAFRVVRQSDLWVPLRSISHSLPAERDSFVGRYEALRELSLRFEANARLISLLGVGGSGKTRVAKRFGWSQLGYFPGGVWFCDLSQASSLDGIARAVAEGLDVPLVAGEPIAQLGNALASRASCLVILDNFEQVASMAELTLGRWLDRAPGAHFIVTTRAVLGLAGEQTFWLSPLSEQEGIQLFMRRAQAAKQDFLCGADEQASLHALIHLLDGLPLAIELAAARIRVMSPRTILQRMSARLKLLGSQSSTRTRQSTLRAAFDWSWDLLSVYERTALAQLTVFQGGIPLDAAEHVLQFSGDSEAPWAIDVLQSLVEKSLLRRSAEDRFELLATVQEYAAEHLRTADRFPGSGDEAATGAEIRHCQYFGRLVRSAPLPSAIAEVDNLVVACRRAVLHRRVGDAVGALEGAWEALARRGPFSVGAELANEVISITQPRSDGEARTNRIAGLALKASGKVDDARARFEAALVGSRAVSDRWCEGRVLADLAALHVDEGRIDEAGEELALATTLARQTEDVRLMCDVLSGSGNLQEHLGNMSEARSCFEEAWAISRQVEDRRLEGSVLGNLGLLDANQGRLAQARVHYEAALVIARELSDRQREGNTLCNLGLLHLMQGRQSEARAALVESLSVARDMGHRRLECIVLCNLGIVLESLDARKEALEHYEAAVTAAKGLGDKRSEGQFYTYVGRLHARDGRFDASRTYLDRSEELLTRVADRLSLGVLMCARAEAEHLEGRPQAANAALERAGTLAKQVQAEADSEFGQSLARVRAILQK